MKTASKLTTALLALAVIALIGSPVMADPPDNYVMKFDQQPINPVTIPGDDGTVTEYWGHDELSTAWSQTAGSQMGPWQGQFMADDFGDRSKDPVMHVKWWGSYMRNPQGGGTNEPDARKVDKFLIAFENDIPADSSNPDSFSQPDVTGPILSQIVLPGNGLDPGTFTESLITPVDPFAGVTEALYQYNAELKCPFPQEPDTVYWLKIVALDDTPQFDPDAIFWGWHDRDYTKEDTLASRPPAPGVDPGEHIQGFVGTAANPTPVWHFQDDAVEGSVLVERNFNEDPLIPCDDWIVQQDVFGPTHYIAGLDGPSQIEGMSKDLAFELHTIPEPGTVFMLLGAGLLGLVASARRRFRS